MDDREKTILTAILDSFIQTGDPVGSRTLSKILALGVSSATIRNIMADLTEGGYLDQPYTSAGRVPTDRAYRFYVNAYIDKVELPEEIKTEIERQVNNPDANLENLLASTAKLLAALTRFTGIAAAPSLYSTRLKLIEFIRVDKHQVYAVLITRSNMIYNKIIEVSEDLPQDFLQSVSKYLTEEFAGQTLGEIREKILASLVEEKEKYHQLLAHVVRLGKKALDFASVGELYVDGKFNIVNGFSDSAQIQRLLLAFEEKDSIVRVLRESLDFPGVRINIGEETGNVDLRDCAVIAAKYGNGSHALGAVGVIGPKRMDYLRVIPIIEYTARMLTSAISSR